MAASSGACRYKPMRGLMTGDDDSLQLLAVGREPRCGPWPRVETTSALRCLGTSGRPAGLLAPPPRGLIHDLKMSRFLMGSEALSLEVVLLELNMPCVFLHPQSMAMLV